MKNFLKKPSTWIWAGTGLCVVVAILGGVAASHAAEHELWALLTKFQLLAFTMQVSCYAISAFLHIKSE